ncbi:MAG: restriction endonuclease subunit S [Bacteroidales bacterium]|nr:restriction endonuclease subunit S [Bacteroidales bacterium]
MPKAWAYKEFEIGGELGLFSSQTGDFDIQKKHINNKGILVVSSGEQNNGIIGKTDVDAKIINENTITVDMFGNVFFRDHKYRMVTHARVFSLEFKNRKISKKVGLYFVAQMKYFNKKFAYDNMASFEKIKNIKISLPITENGDIDFEFMETYISELERERISELDAYLEANRIK